ncbi:STAS domain-containing protein [Streptomyces sp. AM6-12]|uniref:STAS domain-containing protein n=1 Tax=Streptomyces sp. AM6-12 TaxID=3345149 RepID=UPI0037BD18F6
MTEPTLTVAQQLHEAGAVVLEVTGELDHHTAPRLTWALEDLTLAPRTLLVIDLSGVSYCDSTGITVLVTAFHRAEAAGGSLGLAGLSPDLGRVFRTVGLDQVFTCYPTVGDALATLPR